MDDLTRRFAAGPGHFPHQIDLATDRLLFAELTEAEIAAASFLDQRVLTPATKGAWAAMEDVLDRSDHAGPDDAHYIFHIGHVGSTLVSRLLGQIPEVLALREPLVLRGLAEAAVKADVPDAPWDPAQIGHRALVLRRLLARPFRTGQRVIVKATSFTSEVAPLLVAPGKKAVFLHVSPESYLRTILAGEASRRELAMLTGARLVRLARRMDPMPHRTWKMNEGEQIALGWVTEMLSLRAAAAALAPGTVKWIDFDAFLEAPGEALAGIAGHLGIPLPVRAAQAIVVGPTMQRYSKAPEHAYNSGLRKQLQHQVGREHGEALGHGLAWLDRQARDHDEIAAAMEWKD